MRSGAGTKLSSANCSLTRGQHLELVLNGGELAAALLVVQEPDALFTSRIEVAPEFQRRGLGSSLIARVIGEARASARAVSLMVMKVNARALALYERLGFERVGETTTHHHLRLRAVPGEARVAP